MIRGFILATALLGTGAAYADEVIIRRDAPAVVEVPAPSSTTTIEHRQSSDGCQTKSVHSETSAGDSKTVTKTDCD